MTIQHLNSPLLFFKRVQAKSESEKLGSASHFLKARGQVCEGFMLVWQKQTV